MAAPKSPQEMFQVMKGNIEEKTGESFEHWVDLARSAELDKFKALTTHMKQAHGLTHGYAQMVAWGVLDPDRLEAGNEDQGMVDALYAGKKAALRPIYETLMATRSDLGEGVDVVICKTYASLRTRAQFAILAPRTNRYVDLELAMPPGTAADDRLQPIKSSNPKFTHRIRISDPAEVDEGVIDALRKARSSVDG